jgi:hypothetical protein
MKCREFEKGVNNMIKLQPEEVGYYVAMYSAVANATIISDGLPIGVGDAHATAMRVGTITNELFEHMRKGIQISN